MPVRQSVTPKLPLRPTRSSPFDRLFESLEGRRLLAATYTVKDLFPNDGAAIPYGISNNGHVALGSSVGAAVYFNGITTPLKIAGQANDVNNAGQVVGIDASDPNKPVAFIYENGVEKKIPTLGGSISAATAINASGDVVGYSTLATGNGRDAFLYTHSNGKVTDLGLLPGGTNSSAEGINDSGQIVGFATVGPGIPHAFLYSNGQMKDLGVLAGGTNSHVIHGINNAGLIAGDSSTGGSSSVPTGLHVFTSQAGGALKDLGAPANTTNIEPYDINASGTIIGMYDDASFTARGFVESGGTFQQLDTLIDPALKMKIFDAYAINDSGVIVVLGSVGTSDNIAAYSLTPVAAVATPATVGGVVFQDSNSDGKQGNSEAGLKGITVTLKRSFDSAIIGTTTTDASGTYVFNNVTPNVAYDVIATPTVGYNVTTPPNGVFPGPGSDFTGAKGVNFGINYDSSQDDFVGGTVFNDVNGNGMQDAGDAGVAGITVTEQFTDIYNSGVGNKAYTTKTDSSGNYQFVKLPPGQNAVSQTLPAGYKETTANSGKTFITDSGNGPTIVNFGQQKGAAPTTGTISGLAFKDSNGNGKQDNGETGLGGVNVFADGSVQTTAADGSYAFTLAPGSYFIYAGTPGGYSATTVPSATVTVTAGKTTTFSVGETPSSAGAGKSTINGTVYNDANNDGVQDNGEAGIKGVTLSIMQTALASVVSAGAAQPAATSATTVMSDSSGHYSFTGLGAGGYSVADTVPAGDTQTAPASGKYDVTIGFSGSQTISGKDFGLKVKPVAATHSVSGTVFNDANNDHQLDNGETGLAGVTLTLTPSAGGASQTFVTTSSGAYSFTGLAAGNYTIKYPVPAGYTQTTPTSQSFFSFAFADGSPNIVDAPLGFYKAPAQTISISGQAFNDVNGNGLRDQGETEVLPGVTIKLTGLATATTTTGNGGTFTFSNLAPGSYTLTQTALSGYTTTTQPVMLDAPHYDFEPLFGQKKTVTPPPMTASVSGTVFNDVNKNGVKDSSEAGLVGVTLTLTEGNTFQTMTSGADGSFKFSNLQADSYTLSEPALDNFTQTLPANNGNYKFTLSAGQAVTGELFGQSKTPTPPADTASVSGTVFSDANDDGKKTNGETGLAGVTITLTQSQVIGNIKAAATSSVTMLTDSFGNYNFKNLAAGDYTITATTPSGYTQTLPASGGYSVSLAAAQAVGSENFGEYKPVVVPPMTGSIAGVAFNDLNSDGKQEAGEGVLSGVTITLDPENTPKLASAAAVAGEMTTQTAADGSFSFAGLTAGSYFVFQTALSGYTTTTPTGQGASGFEVDLAAGQKVTGELFGQHKTVVIPPTGTGTITGTLFNDTDGDGQQDHGDGVTGIRTVFIDTNGNGILDSGEVSTMSDKFGVYTFNNVAVGTVNISRLFPAGYKLSNPTNPGGKDVIVTVTDGGTAIGDLGTFGKNSGPTPPPPAFGEISGSLFNDTDNDGVMDHGEIATEPRIVFIDTNRNGKVDAGETTTKSDKKGFYRFSNVPVGPVAISRLFPAGFHLSNPSAGTGGNDVLASVLGGRTTTVNLGTHQNA